MSLFGDDDMDPKEMEKITPDYWMRRPCDQYYEEYKECTRYRARMFQYFVHGEKFDCSQWENDHQNCTRWMQKRDGDALISVVENEKQRRTKRLKAQIANKVWEKREGPPEDWNKPLPEFMEKNKYSYITNKLKIDRDGYFATADGKPCSIQ